MKKFAATAFLCAAVATAAAQQTLDRSKVPPPGPTPQLRVPAWTKGKLANGAEFVVAEKHDLPLVSFAITFMGGADQFETAGKRGLAGLTAAMLLDGTTTRDGEALSNALQLLGTSVQTGIGAESGSNRYTSTTAKFEPTLAILADVLQNPTFPASALERLRGQRIVALQQAKNQGPAIANRVFPRVLYGASHPFGQPVTEESITAITREDLVALHREYFRPSRALVTVVGDVTPAKAKASVEKALSGWSSTGHAGEHTESAAQRHAAIFKYPPAPQPKATTIYLVDRPGAAQSSVAIGIPGPPRNTPDYYALAVLNMMLGGHIQSRLSANIREEKGYSYGVRSNFDFGHGPGAFRAGGEIVGDKTDLALIEFMKELKGVEGARPITDEELAMTKDALSQRLLGTFGSLTGIENAITSIWLQNLPEDYYQQYANRIAAITRDDVLRVAKQYVDLNRLAIVIGGDRKSIESGLKATGIAPIVILDGTGAPAGTTP
jgi:predicted Zn-dependent peptidase